MKFDLSKFKKVASDKHSTTLEHPDGHKLHIAHSSVAPKLREQLSALPLHESKHSDKEKPSKKSKEEKEPEQKMAEGGRVKKNPKDDVQEINPEKAKAFVKGATEPGWKQDYWGNIKKSIGMADGGQIKEKKDDSFNKAGKVISESGKGDAGKQVKESFKKALGFAEGGTVIEEEKAKDPVVVNVQAPPTQDVGQPVEDKSLNRRRELYNQEITGNFNQGAVNNMPGMTFGPGGELPSEFNAEAWNRAQQRFSQEQTNNNLSQQKAQVDIESQNIARAQAGLPPIPVPSNPDANAKIPPQALSSEQKEQIGPTVNQQPTDGQQKAQQQLGATPNDPYGTEAYYNAYSKGMSEQRAGILALAEADQMKAQKEAAIAGQQAQKQQNQVNTFNQNVSDLNGERQAFIDDYKNSHVDPNRFMNSKNVGQRVGTVIGLILGGMSAGITGGENPALKFLNQQIDRDIESQRAEMHKNENLLAANYRQFGNMRDAADMTRVMQNDIFNAKLQQAAAQSNDPRSKANALAAVGQLDTQSASILSQMAMRRTLLGGMQKGDVAPERIIQMLVPEHEKEHALKELTSAQNAVSAKDRILDAYDRLTQLNTVGNLANPMAHRQVKAITGAVIPGLSKETAGRFTEADAHYLENIFPKTGNTAETNAKNRIELVKLLNERLHFPRLKYYGIDMSNQGRYDSRGESKIKEMQRPIK